MLDESDVYASRAIFGLVPEKLSSNATSNAVPRWERNKVIYTLYKLCPSVFDALPEKLRDESLSKCAALDVRQANVEVAAISAYKLLSCVSPMLIKTLKEFPYSASDVDLLFRRRSDIDRAVEILLDADYIIERTNEPNKLSAYHYELDEGNSIIRKGVNVDLYRSIGWSGIEYLDNAEIFRSMRKRELRGVEVNVPSAEYDFLITSAHLGTQVDREVLLMDAINLALLSKGQFDISLVIKKAEEDGMSGILFYMLLLVDKFARQTSFGKVCERRLIERINAPVRLKARIARELSDISFPKKISVMSHMGMRKVKAWNECRFEGISKMLSNEYEYFLQTASYILHRNYRR